MKSEIGRKILKETPEEVKVTVKECGDVVVSVSYQKFIIEDDKMILGKIAHHSELTQSDSKKVTGGGWFTYNDKNKSFLFLGDSRRFGKAKIQDIKPIVFKNKVFLNTGELLDNEKYSFHYRSKLQGDIPLI